MIRIPNPETILLMISQGWNSVCVPYPIAKIKSGYYNGQRVFSFGRKTAKGDSDATQDLFV